MNSNPKVSIIIASYNSDKTISKTLESVVNQTFQDWECIVVDGMSKDNTIEIVKEYASKDPRIRYISEPDKGIYDAFNKGWKMAKGEWIHYLGSDDWLTKESFTQLIKESSNIYDVISGGCWIYKIDGSKKKQMSIGFEGCHQAKLTQRSSIEKYSGFNQKYKIFADFDLYLRMKNNGAKIKNVDAMVAYFSMGGTSQSISNLLKCNQEFKCIYKENGMKYSIFKQIHYLTYTYLSIMYRKAIVILKDIFFNIIL